MVPGLNSVRASTFQHSRADISLFPDVLYVSHHCVLYVSSTMSVDSFHGLTVSVVSVRITFLAIFFHCVYLSSYFHLCLFVCTKTQACQPPPPPPALTWTQSYIPPSCFLPVPSLWPTVSVLI